MTRTHAPEVGALLATQKKSGRSDLLANPVGSTLIKTSTHTTLGAIAVILYYLADTYFVGLLGTRELAALSFTFPATILLTYFGVGLGIGTSALVARAIGSRQPERAAAITFASLLLSALAGLAFILPGLLSIRLLFPLLGAGPEEMPLIEDFMQIWLLGVPFLLLQFAGSSVLRACGNARLQGLLMAAGAAGNAILDPILIFGLGPVPALGIAGAAWATVVNWFLVVALICWCLWRQENLLTWRWPGSACVREIWARHLRITGPAALANMITPVATAVLTAALASYGTHAVAAYGVVSRVESLIMIVVLGMSMSLPPFISQNFGAGLHERVREGLRLSLRFVLVWQLALYLLVALAAPWIATLFSADAEVRAIITAVLRILPASYAFQGMTVLTASSFNALHAPRNALLTSLLRFLVFYVPLALLGSQLAGVPGLFAGAALGNLLAGLMTSRWILRYVGELQPALA